MSNHITREDAVAVLWELAGSGIIAEDIADKLEAIAFCISKEQYGFHFWGADVDETTEIFIVKRADLITDEWEAKCKAIAEKHSFIPAEYERAEIEDEAE